MRIDEAYANRSDPVFSFKFFPPKTEEGERNLYNALAELRPLHPAFVSVTYSAVSRPRDKTIEIGRRIKQAYGLAAMAHSTCLAATTEQLRDTPEQVVAVGIDN